MSELANSAILIVEDDKVLASIAAETLREEGYEVFVAFDSSQALAQLRRHLAIRLLLTDINMPGRDGVALATEAIATWPSLAIMFTSGRTFEVAAMPFPATFLPKPFTARQLIAAVGDTRISI